MPKAPDIVAGLIEQPNSVVNMLIRKTKFIEYWVHFSRHINHLLIDWTSNQTTFGPRQANLVLIAYASSEGSGEPAHLRSLARTSAAHSYKQWIKRNLQTESQIPGPSEWLGMRSKHLPWRNARRHKFAWRSSFIQPNLLITSLTAQHKQLQMIRTNSLWKC